MMHGTTRLKCCETLVARVKERMEAEVDGENGTDKCAGA